MVTFYSPYPTASDGQWGATVQGGIATYKFFFEDGTTDGWTAAGPTIIPIEDLDFDGTIGIVTDGKVGPGGYALYIEETTPHSWADNETAWGGIRTPRFPINPGDHVSCLMMIGAINAVAGGDNPTVETANYLDMFHEEGGETYGSSSFDGFLINYLPGTGPPRTGAGVSRYVYAGAIACIECNAVVWDGQAVEGLFEYYVYSKTYLDDNPVPKRLGFRILGAVVTVTTP